MIDICYCSLNMHFVINKFTIWSNADFLSRNPRFIWYFIIYTLGKRVSMYAKLWCSFHLEVVIYFRATRVFDKA